MTKFRRKWLMFFILNLVLGAHTSIWWITLLNYLAVLLSIYLFVWAKDPTE